MKKLVLVFLLAAAPADAKTILFVGNSFTFGANSAAHYYKPDTVTDLNGPGAGGKTVGGVPAFFKAFTKEAGLDYSVSLETVGGKGLEFHYAEKRALLDKPWTGGDAWLFHPGHRSSRQSGAVSSAKQMPTCSGRQNPRGDIGSAPLGAAPTRPIRRTSPGMASRSSKWARISRWPMTRRPRLRMSPA